MAKNPYFYEKHPLCCDEGKFTNNVREEMVRTPEKNSYRIKCGSYYLFVYHVSKYSDTPSGWAWEVHQNYVNDNNSHCIHRSYKGIDEEDSKPCKTRQMATAKALKLAVEWAEADLKKLRWLSKTGVK